MRIAMILSTPLPPQEGIGFYVWNLSRHLLKQGHQVLLVTRGGARPTTYEEVDGIRIWRPTFIPIYPFHVHFHGLFVSKLVRKLESSIDLFHLHSPLVPVISTKRPVMLTFHSTVPLDVKLTRVQDLYSFLMKLQAPVSYQLEIRNLQRATCVNGVSPRVTEALRNYPHCPTNTEVMWNGVNIQEFYPTDVSKTLEKFVISVGRLSAGKGLEDLVKAASIVIHKSNNFKFLIVGDGNLRSSLKNLVNNLGLEGHIHFTGHIFDRDRLVDLYRKAALFVLPSHHEGLPSVLLEAMACGCPVLTTDVGGIPFLIQDGENGVLIPPGDPMALGQCILELLGNPQLLTRLGKLARETVEERFSWEMIGYQYLQQYSCML